MAVEQQPLQRSITLPTTQVSTGSGLSQLSDATSKISNLVTERINDVAVEKAATQGAADVQEGTQPKSLALPFTRATKAYNNAVVNTEANRMVDSAQKLINETLVNSKNPATFNRETPAKFHSDLEGIKSGILEQARDENREVIREHIEKLAANASLNMLQHSIEFDNQQNKLNFNQDITNYLEQRRNAAVAGDMDRVAGADVMLEQTLSNYSAMNAEIARSAAALRKNIETHRQVDNALHGYATALEDGNQALYLKDLAENKDNLPYNVWQDAVKGVVALDQEHKKLSNDFNAIQWAQVQDGISSGVIQNESDILGYDLYLPQSLTAMKELRTAQAKEIKQNSGFIDAQQNILRGRPTWNSTDIRNKMFKTQVQNFEAQTGKVATLVDMSQSVLGQNDFPASGMPKTAIGANVPAFDSVVSQKLTSGDPIQTAQAAMVYNDMVNIQDKPNSLKVTGDALAVASLFDEIKQGGTPPEEAAGLAINTVLNATEPQMAARIDRFHKTYENQDSNGVNELQRQYKQMFGVDSQTFGADQSFKLFSDKFRAYYLSSNSEAAALSSVKQDMLPYGTSKHFDKGFVGQPVPEKEIPITKVGYSFDNQILTNVQAYINRTDAARAAHPELNIPKVEWANHEQKITGAVTDDDKVFKKMTIGDRPRIKINGHETDVVLMPSPSSRIGNSLNYLLGTYDIFNNLNPLRDVTNGTDQVARFSPKELSSWAPSIATKKTDEALREVAKNAQSQEYSQDEAELKALNKETPPLLVMLGLESPKKYLDYISKKSSETKEGRIEALTESLKHYHSSDATRAAITEAGNVGIADDGQVTAGNIDLDTRPRVKNKDGTISTVRTIGTEFNGLEYVIPTVTDDGKILSDDDAIKLFRKTGKHLGAFQTVDQANKFAEALHESEAQKVEAEAAQPQQEEEEEEDVLESVVNPVPQIKEPPPKESKVNSVPEIKEPPVEESKVNKIPEIKEPPHKLSEETISARQVERATDRTDKRESRGKAKKEFKSNIEMIFPKVGEKEIARVISAIDFEKGNLENQITKAVNFLSSSNDEPTKPTKAKKENRKPDKPFNINVDQVEAKAHKNAPLLEKTIDDIRNMEGSINDKANVRIVNQVQKLYPHLNKKQSKVVVDNFYFILNKRKLNEET